MPRKSCHKNGRKLTLTETAVSREVTVEGWVVREKKGKIWVKLLRKRVKFESKSGGGAPEAPVAV